MSQKNHRHQKSLSPTFETEEGAALSNSSGVPLQGIKLFNAVFAELTQKHLAKEFSTADLMRAAQQLIDLSKEEFVGAIHKRWW